MKYEKKHKVVKGMLDIIIKNGMKPPFILISGRKIDVKEFDEIEYNYIDSNCPAEMCYLVTKENFFKHIKN